MSGSEVHNYLEIISKLDDIFGLPDDPNVSDDNLESDEDDAQYSTAKLLRILENYDDPNDGFMAPTPDPPSSPIPQVIPSGSFTPVQLPPSPATELSQHDRSRQATRIEVLPSTSEDYHKMSDDTDEENSVDNQQIRQSSSSEELEDDSTWEPAFEDDQTTADSEDSDESHKINTARKRTSNSDSRGNPEQVYHGDKKISDDTLLIKHLYKILRSEAVENPPDLAECNECSAVFDNPEDLKAHARSHVETVRLAPNTFENKFYRCFKCGVFMHSRYVGSYKLHMFKNHGIDEPSMVLVPYDPHCRFCSSVISATRNLNRHIQMKHTKIFLQKVQKYVKQKPDSQSHKYKCLKCNKQFVLYKSARRHGYNKHPDFKGMNLFKKITYIKKAVPVKLIKKKNVVEKNTNVSRSHWPLVPKKVLFKCDQCELHFTNYAAATQHSASSSHKDQIGWKCPQCQLSFKVTEKKQHLRQHDVTDTFKVYTAALTMRNRMLCKCPQCKFYLHEQDFWSHYENKCERRLGSDCFQCKAPIHRASVKFHNQLHTVEGYTCDDMIWIEYVKVSVETPGVPKEPTISRTYKKTKPAGYKLTISYCQNCKCCMIGKKTLQAHLAGNCASKLVKKRRKICITCGLKFTYHKKCPMRCTGIKLDDMKFVRIQDQKIIEPPIPKYIKCEECGINVSERLEIDLHDCGRVKKTCKYCKEHFSDIAYQPHLALHEYRKARRGAENKMSEILKVLKKYVKFYKKKPSESDKNSFLSKEKDTSEDDSSEDYNRNKEPPENQKIVKKQSSSILKRPLESNREVPKKMGNLVLKDQMQCSSKERNTCFQLWKCEDGLYFTSKDAAEAHASRRSAGNKGSSVNCSQCGRLFDTSELFKHLCKHHRNNKNVSFDVFPVSHIAYDEDSETDKSDDSEWDQEYIDEKMNKFSPIAYKCNCCSMHFMSQSALQMHSRRMMHGAFGLPGKSCDLCGLVFAPRSLVIHKTLHHDILKLSRKDIVIRQEGKKIFCTGHSQKPRKIIVKNAEMKSTCKTKRLDLYKCTECQLHFNTFKALEWHMSYTDHSASRNMVYCHDCGLGFTKKSLAIHTGLHRLKKHLALKDFKIFAYSERSSGNTEEVSRATRDKCSLGTEDVDELTKGEKPSNVATTPSTLSSRDNYNNNLYKCDTCLIHFIDEGSLRNHKQINRHTDAKCSCAICDLTFDLDAIPTHIDIHHQKLNLNAKDFNIVSELNDSNVGIAESFSDSIVSPYRRPEGDVAISNRETRIKLYKCADCDVHFIAQNSCYKHALNHRRMDPKEYIKCKICGLQFKIVTLSHHMHRHHKTEGFKIEDVLIEEYQPDVLTNGAPKLNIYQASHKVQSALDSTTTDKDVDVPEARQSDPNNSTE